MPHAGHVRKMRPQSPSSVMTYCGMKLSARRHESDEDGQAAFSVNTTGIHAGVDLGTERLSCVNAVPLNYITEMSTAVSK